MSAQAQTAQKAVGKIIVFGTTLEKVAKPQWEKTETCEERDFYITKTTTRTSGHDPSSGRYCIVLDVDIKDTERQAN